MAWDSSLGAGAAGPRTAKGGTACRPSGRSQSAPCSRRRRERGRGVRERLVRAESGASRVRLVSEGGSGRRSLQLRLDEHGRGGAGSGAARADDGGSAAGTPSGLGSSAVPWTDDLRPYDRPTTSATTRERSPRAVSEPAARGDHPRFFRSDGALRAAGGALHLAKGGPAGERGANPRTTRDLPRRTLRFARRALDGLPLLQREQPGADARDRRRGGRLRVQGRVPEPSRGSPHPDLATFSHRRRDPRQRVRGRRGGHPDPRDDAPDLRQPAHRHPEQHGVHR